MPKADKKQRHRAKREAKRREMRRQQSISPIKRLADAPGEVECWMSDDFEDFGQAQIFIWKRAAGLTGVACFLVDRGVVGVKDAWTRVNIERPKFEEMLERCSDGGIAMRRSTPEEVRRLIAGGIRWAHENGMRLPKEWVKTASLIGGVGDWMNADTSRFVKEFAGHPDDLRQRLVSEPFDSYIERDDINFTFSELAPHMDQKTGEYVDDDEEEFDDPEEKFGGILDGVSDDDIRRLIARLTPIAMGMASENTLWLAARGQPPAPKLISAWESILLAALYSEAAIPGASEGERTAFGQGLMQEMAERFGEMRSEAFRASVEQALEFLETDPLMVQRAAVKHLPSVDLDNLSAEPEGT